MTEIIINPKAEIDLENIFIYSIENWGLAQATKYRYEFEDAFNDIQENPMIGFAIDEVRENYRLYHFKRHLVIYRVSHSAIIVIRVLGDEMDIDRHI